MESFAPSPPLNQDWPQDSLWPVDYGGSDLMPIASFKPGLPEASCTSGSFGTLPGLASKPQASLLEDERPCGEELRQP